MLDDRQNIHKVPSAGQGIAGHARNDENRHARRRSSISSGQGIAGQARNDENRHARRRSSISSGQGIAGHARNDVSEGFVDVYGEMYDSPGVQVIEVVSRGVLCTSLDPYEDGGGY